MYNLLISLGGAVLAFALFYFGVGLHWTGALFPALVIGPVGYFFLARRTLKQVEAIVLVAQKDLMAKRIEPGLAKLNEAFALAKWQFLVASQVHAQVGSLLYMLQRFDEAKPHLQKAFVRMGQARAMLGCLYFKEKNYDEMAKVFDQALTHSKKDGFVWSIYAYCLEKAGQRDKALEMISKGLAESPSDEKMKANQLALQNKERMRMKAYGQEWYAFHLEPPPTDFVPPHMRGQLTQRNGYRTPRKV